MSTKTTIARTAARFVRAHEGERVRVQETDLVVKASAFDTDGMYEVLVGSAPEGAQLAPLRHPWEELYYVLDGAIELRIGDDVRLASAGDFVVVPADAEHGFTVVTEFARFLNVTMGPGAAAAAVRPAAPAADGSITSGAFRPLL